MSAPEVQTVLAWHEALNAGDADRLVKLSHPGIEVGGPRGGGRGGALLREWVAAVVRHGMLEEALDASGLDRSHETQRKENAVETNCTHLDQIRDVEPGAEGCEECLQMGDTWVHLRECLSCGHVGCCDSSKNRHATKHYRATEHPIVRSFQPGEAWIWCYVDEVVMEPR